MSPVGTRVDDFRCHDERLVQILPGREEEAVEVALSLRDADACDGVFVAGKDVIDWRFVERVGSLDRFFFSNVDRSFKEVDMSVLRNARALGIAETETDLDLRLFERLSFLSYQWKSLPDGLAGLPSLREVRFWGVGKDMERGEFGLPPWLEVFRVTGYTGNRLQVGDELSSLDVLSLSRARNLVALPRLDSVRSVDISFVGRDVFDYQTIPEDVEELVIDSCAPIQDWRFLEGKTRLRRLFIDRTKFVAPDASTRTLIGTIEDVHVPALRMEASS
ncbi:MAG: hypothetical protein JNJ62_09805 [Pseudoxanthomonas mexicana]|nr:hypothetical protein [Pseudoxanthomonas mexicana]